MTRLNKVGQTLQMAEQKTGDARAERVKAVESELGLPRLEPEMKALYRAIFKKLTGPAATPVEAPAEPGSVIPPTPVIGGF